MPSPTTTRIGLGIGALMIAMGVYIAGRLVLAHGAPITGTTGLDVAFAVFFTARGALQVQRWRRARERAGANAPTE